jgi:GDP-L-fucose synthase
MNILITGGNGYIAKSLASSLNNVTSITRKDFDLTDREATDNWFFGKVFDVVIHTAVVGGSRLKVDNGDTFYQNIQMFYNLLNNKYCFDKLLHFGSGAELNMPSDPYGLSKNVISKIIDNEEKFYNIRIYGVFDENELDTRFIKNNIKRYINKEPMQIHQDKIMDFFYMKDLIQLVEHFVHEDFLPKNIDCSYGERNSLLDIAHIINDLSEHKVAINTGKGKGKDYVGDWNPLDIKWKGLEQGIKETYKQLLNEKY